MEPSETLKSTLATLDWSVHRNLDCPRAASWPRLSPEARFPGTVLLEPQDEPPPADAIWTDGSIRSSGGSALIQMSTNAQCLTNVPTPRSSTQCELVALSLVSSFQPIPSLVMSDSLCSLQLIRP